MRESHLFSRQRVGYAASQTAGRPAHRLSGRRAFTLTELLIVVAIIAVLASLITAAAVNAMRNGRRARILLEIKQMAMAMEQLKNDYGAYPPNVFPIADPDLDIPDINTAEKKNVSDLTVFFSKAASRSAELSTGANPNTGRNNISPLSNYGLSPAEAAVFWLMGFSSDVQRPLSGSDLRAVDISDDNGDNINDVVTVDSFTPRYDFDRSRLRISRDKNGDPRILQVYNVNGQPVRILLYEYLAPGSEKPYVYFDTSRGTPSQVLKNYSAEFFLKDDTGYVVALKQLKKNAPNNPTWTHAEYVEQRKFQIMHPGLDDAWGDFQDAEMTTNELPFLMYPDGPFTGDLADTLTSFFDGPLADAEEN